MSVLPEDEAEKITMLNELKLIQKEYFNTNKISEKNHEISENLSPILFKKIKCTEKQSVKKLRTLSSDSEDENFVERLKMRR